MIQLYNSLSGQKEAFEPLDKDAVGMYTCGPTVYDHVTIGNWRTYTLGDIVRRTLEYNGYSVNYVMNITDVGHLTGDNEGDSSSGQDRLEKAASRENLTAWDIAEKYTQEFLEGFKELNIEKPQTLPRATEHIQEQIDLIQEIENQGFTYKTSDGIYFDVVAYENAGNTYGILSTLDQRKEGARVKKNPERKDPRDFALWKFSPKEEQRDMEWESPWGKGFPGWHVECSAMSMKYLGEQFDIHIGGEDLRSTHHPNEVAQSEAATNKHPFVKYWMHGSFLLVDDGRMGKSLGNAYALHDIREHGFSPLALRYFYLTGHYRKQLNFTWEALEAASNALEHLYEAIRALPNTTSIDDKYQSAFKTVVNDDLNMPQALAVVWDLLGDTSVDPGSKKATLLDFDKVLGLNLEEQEEIEVIVPEEIKKLVQEREKARENKDFDTADEIRESIEKQGYTIIDAEDSPKIRKIKKS